MRGIPMINNKLKANDKQNRHELLSPGKQVVGFLEVYNMAVGAKKGCCVRSNSQVA